MNAEINYAPATGKVGIVKPCLIGSVGVVKGQIHRVDLPKRVRLNKLANQANPFHKPIGQIDAEEPVRSSRSINHSLSFRAIPGQRLLAKHGDAALKGSDGLLRM